MLLVLNALADVSGDLAQTLCGIKRYVSHVREEAGQARLSGTGLDGLGSYNVVQPVT